MNIFICDALRDMVPFVQFKKCEKHPKRSLTFSKVASYKSANLLKVTLLHGRFSRFLNCTNDTKSQKTLHFISDASRVTMTNKLNIGFKYVIFTKAFKNTSYYLANLTLTQ